MDIWGDDENKSDTWETIDLLQEKDEIKSLDSRDMNPYLWQVDVDGEIPKNFEEVNIVLSRLPNTSKVREVGNITKKLP